MSAAITIVPPQKTTGTILHNDIIITQLAKRDENTFEHVFKTYYKNLHSYVCTILKEETYAEEIVQQVFFKLWDKAETITIAGPVAAYLYRAVHNESLNYLKHQKVKSAHRMHVAYSMKDAIESAPKTLQTKELEKKILDSLNELPEQCRTIFQMSRFDDMKYREIAAALGIAVKTVENQMGKALKILREKLVDYLPLLVLFFKM